MISVQCDDEFCLLLLLIRRRPSWPVSFVFLSWPPFHVPSTDVFFFPPSIEIDPIPAETVTTLLLLPSPIHPSWLFFLLPFRLFFSLSGAYYIISAPCLVLLARRSPLLAAPSISRVQTKLTQERERGRIKAEEKERGGLL